MTLRGIDLAPFIAAADVRREELDAVLAKISAEHPGLLEDLRRALVQQLEAGASFAEAKLALEAVFARLRPAPEAAP